VLGYLSSLGFPPVDRHYGTRPSQRERSRSEHRAIRHCDHQSSGRQGSDAQNCRKFTTDPSLLGRSLYTLGAHTARAAAQHIVGCVKPLATPPPGVTDETNVELVQMLPPDIGILT
jgi:hypothetical protein